MASVPAFQTISSLWDKKSGMVIGVGLEPSSKTPVGTGDAGLMTMEEFHRLGMSKFTDELANLSPYLLLRPKFT